MSLYETLRAVWQRERDSKELQKLEEDFFEKTRPYVNHLETQSKNEPDQLLAELFHKRWLRVNYLINDIISLRMTKHIRDAREGTTAIGLMPVEEQKFRKRLNSLLSSFRDEVLGVNLDEAQIEEQEPSDDAYNLVLFKKKDQDVTVGADLRTYGPFDINDLAYIPVANVRNYLKRSQVEKIDVS